MLSTGKIRKLIIAGSILIFVLLVGIGLLLTKLITVSDDTIFSLEIDGTLCKAQPCPIETTIYTVSQSGLVAISGQQNDQYSLDSNQLTEVTNQLRQILNMKCSPQIDEHFSTSFTIHLDGQTKTDSSGGCKDNIDTLLRNLAKG